MDPEPEISARNFALVLVLGICAEEASLGLFTSFVNPVAGVWFVAAVLAVISYQLANMADRPKRQQQPKPKPERAPGSPPPRPPKPPRPRATNIYPEMPEMRRGLTLVELLVVIVILLILTAVAIPALSPNGEQRRIREASRMVNTFISGARNKAMSTGHAVGVVFERATSNPYAAMVLHYTETPPLYAGETVGSVCRLSAFGDGDPVTIRATMPTADFNNKLIRVGDLIKFNYQGHTFRITGPAAADGTIADSSDPTISIECAITPQVAGRKPNMIFPWAVLNDEGEWEGQSYSEVPYQITRQPIKSSEAPLQLPEGAVVDLRLSGEGIGWIGDNPDAWPCIVFSPTGAVSQVYHFDSPDLVANRSPMAPVHFLIGRSDGVGQSDTEFPDEKVVWNLRDLNNLWVSVGTQTGIVSTAENAFSPEIPSITVMDDDFQNAVTASRSIAATLQGVGGR